LAAMTVLDLLGGCHGGERRVAALGSTAARLLRAIHTRSKLYGGCAGHSDRRQRRGTGHNRQRQGRFKGRTRMTLGALECSRRRQSLFDIPSVISYLARSCLEPSGVRSTRSHLGPGLTLPGGREDGVRRRSSPTKPARHGALLGGGGGGGGRAHPAEPRVRPHGQLFDRGGAAATLGRR
jgi:hypothetical protein